MHKKLIILFILTLLLNIIYSDDKFKGVYFINSNRFSLKLFINNFSFFFKAIYKIGGLNKFYFRFISLNSNSYYIESISSNKRITNYFNNNLILIDKNNTENSSFSIWNIIKINDEEYLIQNNKTKKFLENDNYNSKCSNDITNYLDCKNNKNISDKK